MRRHAMGEAPESASEAVAMDDRSFRRNIQEVEGFRALPPRREWWSLGARLPRHRHMQGYVTIVLSGGYEEAGEFGRYRVSAGDAMLHGPFDAHANRLIARSTELFSMPLPPLFMPVLPHVRLVNPDAVIVEAEQDATRALQVLLDQMRPREGVLEGWPDLLALAINSGSTGQLGSWADDNRLHPASLARGFRQLYGVSPARYRAELRSKEAWRQLIHSDVPLVALAHDLGFADQAHLSRGVKQLTGYSPGQWRRLKKFKT